MRRRTTTERGYGAPWQRLRIRILERDRRRCHYCGGPANSVDHVVPKIDGGTDHPANLVACCTPCNSRRSMDGVRARRKRPGDRARFSAGVGGGFFGALVPRVTSSASFRPIQPERSRYEPIRPDAGVLARARTDPGR